MTRMGDTVMGETVTVRFFAAARRAAGQRDEQRVAARSLDDLRAELVRLHGDDMARVLPRCAFLVDGVGRRGDDAKTPLPPGCVVDVLPPFAGG